MEFLHEGDPELRIDAEWKEPVRARFAAAPAPPAGEGNALLAAFLARDNLRSAEQLERTYDHEVKGLTVVKPWIGAHRDVPGRRRGLPDRPRRLATWATRSPRRSSPPTPTRTPTPWPRPASTSPCAGWSPPAPASTASRSSTTTAGPIRCRARRTPTRAHKAAQLVRASPRPLRDLPGLRHAAHLRQGLDEERRGGGRAGASASPPRCSPPPSPWSATCAGP